MHKNYGGERNEIPAMSTLRNSTVRNKLYQIQNISWILYLCFNCTSFTCDTHQQLIFCDVCYTAVIIFFLESKYPQCRHSEWYRNRLLKLECITNFMPV
jgi:hypothetical protein